MASNFFGDVFRITTFGESHGPAIGVVIDGCPAGIAITKQEIDDALALRQGGVRPYTSARKEPDSVEILSGVYKDLTTGAPIALLVRNSNIDSRPYEELQSLYRPGHAQFAYLKKYNIFDDRGGGRASARETVARVAAGVVAKKILIAEQIECVAFVAEIGGIAISAVDPTNLHELRRRTHASLIFCPDLAAEQAICERLNQIKQEGDSLGGIVGCMARLPAGLGDPIYGKLEALLASAMLSLPASKGFEIGDGFAAARMKASEHTDSFTVSEQGEVQLATNHCGGVLGGISTGSPLFFRVAFKPISSIKKPQKTLSLDKKQVVLKIPESARHDLTATIRAVPIVEAMTAIVLVDALLISFCNRRQKATSRADNTR